MSLEKNTTNKEKLIEEIQSKLPCLSLPNPDTKTSQDMVDLKDIAAFIPAREEKIFIRLMQEFGEAGIAQNAEYELMRRKLQTAVEALKKIRDGKCLAGCSDLAEDTLAAIRGK